MTKIMLGLVCVFSLVVQAAETCPTRIHDTLPLSNAIALDKTANLAFLKAAGVCASPGIVCDAARVECGAAVQNVITKQVGFDETAWLRDMLLPYSGETYPATRPLREGILATDVSCSVDVTTLNVSADKRSAQASRREMLLAEYPLYVKWVQGAQQRCQEKVAADAAKANMSKAELEKFNAAQAVKKLADESAKKQAEADKAVADAKAASQKAIDDARKEGDTKSTQAKREADEKIAAATREAEQVKRDADSKMTQAQKDADAKAAQAKKEADEKAARAQKDAEVVKKDSLEKTQNAQKEADTKVLKAEKDAQSKTDQAQKQADEKVAREKRSLEEAANKEKRDNEARAEQAKRDSEKQAKEAAQKVEKEKTAASEKAQREAEQKVVDERESKVAALKKQKLDMVTAAEEKLAKAKAEEATKRQGALDAVKANPGAAQAMVADAAAAEKVRIAAEQNLIDTKKKADEIEVDESHRRSALSGALYIGALLDSGQFGLGGLVQAHVGIFGVAPSDGMASGVEIRAAARAAGIFGSTTIPSYAAIETLATVRYFFGRIGVGGGVEFTSINAFTRLGVGASLGLAIVDTPRNRVSVNVHYLPIGTQIDFTRTAVDMELSFGHFSVSLLGGIRTPPNAALGWQLGAFFGGRLFL
jgi:hypothetical protein